MTTESSKPLTVVSYGGGTNSTAMLVGLHERGERPDLILFADTGGEKPHTYEHISFMQSWLFNRKFPQIKTVYKGGKPETLEDNCLRMKMLPSIAYGRKGCSHKYKKEPQEQFANNYPECRVVWRHGGKVTKCIGYDAGEPHRASIPEDEKYIYRYPLIDWNWGRDECIAAIDRGGIPQPGKSACFFCPSSKKHEILSLRDDYPQLMERALELEANAETTFVKGLGRDFAWSDLLKWDADQIKLFGEQTMEIACECYDGD